MGQYISGVFCKNTENIPNRQSLVKTFFFRFDDTKNLQSNSKENKTCSWFIVKYPYKLIVGDTVRKCVTLMFPMVKKTYLQT